MSQITDFFQGGGYQSFASSVKWIFGILSVLFFVLAIFAYIKAHFLLKSHSHGGAHGSGHGVKHGDMASSAATVHEEEPWRTSARDQAHPPSDYAAQWEHIKRRSDSLHEAEWKLAVIEADNLADEVLKAVGYNGESMGERLMMIKPEQLDSLQDLWDAHKLRNLLVHYTGYQVRHEQVFAALHSFEKVLKELGALPS